MSIDWGAVLTGSVSFFILLILKSLLDLKLVQFSVKYLSWIPVRSLFRAKPSDISGNWEQTWESAGSTRFTSPTDRHSHPVIKQLGSYCYAEFISKEITYVIFGRVIGAYVVGDWYDKSDPLGYFGTFQLEIVNSHSMIGKWIGHSKSTHEIKGDQWVWKKLKT